MAHLTNFSFDFFWNFTEDASLLLYHGAKKSKMTKNSNQGGGGSVSPTAFYNGSLFNCDPGVLIQGSKNLSSNTRQGGSKQKILVAKVAVKLEASLTGRSRRTLVSADARGTLSAQLSRTEKESCWCLKCRANWQSKRRVRYFPQLRPTTKAQMISKGEAQGRHLDPEGGLRW